MNAGPPFDVLTMGRVGVDFYPTTHGSIVEVRHFYKFLGGSPTNVAVAAARLGERAAVITRTGPDPLGEYVHAELRDLGVDDRYVTSVEGLQTPVTFCETFPPDRFPIYFYRAPKAPDLEIYAEDLDLEVIRAARLFWATLSGLSAEPSRTATMAALAARARRHPTMLDLDYRPAFWSSRAAATQATGEALAHASVAVGNLEEVNVAVGTRDPDEATDRLLDLGLQLAVVKLGPEGVLAKSRDERVEVPPVPVTVVNGLGAGDAFGGSLCHGLLAGWPLADTVRFASAAGAIVASKLACAEAMPTVCEVEDMLRRGRGHAQERKHVSEQKRRMLSETRFHNPGAVAEAAAARKVRDEWASDRLLIVAADHTARGVIGIGDIPGAMGDRYDMLERLVTALAVPGVGGLLGSPDVVEDLLLLGVLDNKVVFGSMNRGGLADATFEYDDRFTGYDAASVVTSRLDGGKMLLRINLEDPATADTLSACASAITELALERKVAMVEPFMSRRVSGRAENDLSIDAIIRSMAIAAALGATSAYTWLKVPVVDDMAPIAEATTLPLVLLGGERTDRPDEMFERWQRALGLPGVRGLVIGRNLLYPKDDDVEAAVKTAASLL